MTHLILDSPVDKSVCYDVNFSKNVSAYSNQQYFHNTNEKISLKNNFMVYKIHTGNLINVTNRGNEIRTMTVKFLNNLFLCDLLHPVLILLDDDDVDIEYRTFVSDNVITRISGRISNEISI